jgi:hypothetical protein
MLHIYRSLKGAKEMAEAERIAKTNAPEPEKKTYAQMNSAERKAYREAKAKQD